MSVIYWIGTVDGDLFKALNWFGGVRPGVSDIATFDNDVHTIINWPDDDSGGARTWAGINLVSGTWTGDGGVFSGITVVGNVDASFPLDLNLKSVNGSITGNVNFSLSLESQQSGHTATLHEDVSFAPAGIGSVTFASDFVGETAVDAYDGSITVDTITLDGFGSSVSALAISQLAFLNGGKLTNFLGPVSEVVWCGYTSANPLTASNWSDGAVPGTLAQVYIDSRIKIDNVALGATGTLPLTWATSVTFDSLQIASGAGESYDWQTIAVEALKSLTDVQSFYLRRVGAITGTIDLETLTVKNQTTDLVAPLAGSVDELVVQNGLDAEIEFNDTTISSATIGTSFTGTLVNSRTNPTTTGIVDLNGSTLSSTTWPAQMSPSASAFTNFTNVSRGGVGQKSYSSRKPSRWTSFSPSM